MCAASGRNIVIAMQIGFSAAERGGIAGNRKQLKSIASLLLLLFCRCSVMNDYRTRRRRKQDCWRRLINPVGQTASSEKSKTSIPYQQEQEQPRTACVVPPSLTCCAAAALLHISMGGRTSPVTDQYFSVANVLLAV